MGFSTKRGRPKKTEVKLEIIINRKPEDKGTEELQAKRMLGLTAEPIDICREKGLIDAGQYTAALHFRWLYTIRFGAPGISAFDIENHSNYGRNTRAYDEAWQASREMEYAMAVEKLRSRGALKMVMNIALFNHCPSFIKKHKTMTKSQLRQNIVELDKFRTGLDILTELWGIMAPRDLKYRN